MKINDARGSHSTGLMLLLCCIACVALIISFAMPLESRGAGGMVIKEADEGLSIGDLKAFREIVPIHISAEIVSLEVTVMDEAYVGEAYLQPFNKEEIGAHAIIAIIPSNRVQRMFEVAMEMGERIECYGYKISAPPGHELSGMPFYKIITAKVRDSDVALIVVALEAP